MGRGGSRTSIVIEKQIKLDDFLSELSDSNQIQIKKHGRSLVDLYRKIPTFVVGTIFLPSIYFLNK